MLKICEKNITKYSTIRTKAIAKYFCTINNSSDLYAAINFSQKKKIKFKILGNGSNILFAKEYYDKLLFIKLGKKFNYFNIDNKYAEIGASHSLIQAGRKLISMGYKSFIFFNLIPANIGGALRQNAGTGSGEEIKDVLASCILYDVYNNKIKVFKGDELELSYRNSIIKNNPNRYVVLSAKFKLGELTKDIKKLDAEMKNRVKEKLAREPKGYCFGSTFMNSDKYAWEYVDAIQGELNYVKNAYFSKKHKNWIINKDASGDEIFKLIKDAQKLVKEKFNIQLYEEVDIIA